MAILGTGILNNYHMIEMSLYFTHAATDTRFWARVLGTGTLIMYGEYYWEIRGNPEGQDGNCY